MKRSLHETTALFIDCQTSGPTPASGAIIEFAFCLASAKSWSKKSDPTNIKSFFIKLPKAAEPLSNRITKLTGISQNDVTSKESISRRKLKKFLQKTLVKKPLFAVAHFASFEKKFLDDLFGAKGFPLPIICTHQIAKKIYPSLPSKGIRGVAGFLNWPNSQSASEGTYLKRSKDHVDATCWIWQHLCQEFTKFEIHSPECLGKWLETKEKLPKPKREYSVDNAFLSSLPKQPGVYKMLNGKGEILYIGKATSLRSRVTSYFRGQKGKNSRLLEMVTQVKNIDLNVTETAIEAALLENDEIRTHNPPYNVALKNFDQKIYFTNRDFTSLAEAYSANHPIGPFAGSDALNFILQLFKAVQAKRKIVIPDNFIGTLVEKDILRAGFILFLKSFDLSPDAIESPRDLVARGLALYREYKKLASSEADEEDDVDEEVEELIWTPEIVAESFKKNLCDVGRAYRLAKDLFNLSHGEVRWQTEDNKWRVLSLKQSQIIERKYLDESTELAPTCARETAPFTLSKTDYNRLRILRTELKAAR